MSQFTTKTLVGQPSARSLYDALATAYESGSFAYFATFRTPSRDAPNNGDPRHDPEAQTKLAEEIALSLAKREGIAVAIAPAFVPVNSTKPTTPHYHAALSRPPSPAWQRAFAAEFGPRAVDVRELGTSPKDPQRVAWYHAKQSVSITVAYRDSTGKVSLRTSALDDAGELVEDLEQVPGPDPASSDEPPREIPPEARPATPTPTRTPELSPEPLPEPGTVTREEAIALTLAWFDQWEATLPHRPRPPPTRP